MKVFFSNDKKIRTFCLTIVKAERGAGATTLWLANYCMSFHKKLCGVLQLLEFHDSLAGNMEKINQHCPTSRHSLLLDSEMANLPEFGDFKNDAERRNLNLKLLIC